MFDISYECEDDVVPKNCGIVQKGGVSIGVQLRKPPTNKVYRR